MSGADLRRLQRLVEELESDDAFERRDAIDELESLTHQRLEYDWSAAATLRAGAVRRWRKWLEDEKEQRENLAVHVQIEALAHGQLEPAMLQKLLTALPPDQKKALIQQIIVAKAAAEATHGSSHAPCARCAQRPATVRVTSRRTDGAYESHVLCEVCAGQADGA